MCINGFKIYLISISIYICMYVCHIDLRRVYESLKKVNLRVATQLTIDTTVTERDSLERKQGPKVLWSPSASAKPSETRLVQ